MLGFDLKLLSKTNFGEYISITNVISNNFGCNIFELKPLVVTSYDNDLKNLSNDYISLILIFQIKIEHSLSTKNFWMNEHSIDKYNSEFWSSRDYNIICQI